MTIQIHDSLAGVKRPFIPVVAGQVSLYVCGMTVYDYCHIGHARSLLAFDMVVRYFQFCGLSVNFVRNITDVDDKIIRRAQENKEDCAQLVERFVDAMREDESALGIAPPTHEPKATDHISHMQEMIQTLIDKDAAYVSEQGDVCFAVEKFEKYGALSGRNIEQLRAGARVQDDRGKRNPLDFVLWKPAKPDEPAWDSPWGAGRPGWHIECSAMSKSLLGLPFDIHGGGMDLKFPHHENEIAQTEAADCCGFANYWMHSGLLNVEGEKMSKSLGNFVTIRDALQDYSSEQIRFFMFNSHYGSPVNYSKAQMEQSQASLWRLYLSIRGFSTENNEPLDSALAAPYVAKFREAMDDNFNTPVAFVVFFELAKEINKLRDEKSLAKATALASVLKQLAAVVGILREDPDVFLKSGKSPAEAEGIESLIASRVAARESKDWAKADEIRDKLQALGVVIEDAGGQTTWRFEG